jgi:hypothetical protein
MRSSECREAPASLTADVWQNKNNEKPWEPGDIAYFAGLVQGFPLIRYLHGNTASSPA